MLLTLECPEGAWVSGQPLGLHPLTANLWGKQNGGTTRVFVREVLPEITFQYLLNQRSSATAQKTAIRARLRWGCWLFFLYSSVFPSLPPFDKQFLQMLKNLFSQMLISNHSYSFEANYQLLTLCPHSYLSKINHFITWTSVSIYFSLVNPNKTIKFFIKVLLLIY